MACVCWRDLCLPVWLMSAGADAACVGGLGLRKLLAGKIPILLGKRQGEPLPVPKFQREIVILGQYNGNNNSFAQHIGYSGNITALIPKAGYSGASDLERVVLVH